MNCKYPQKLQEEFIQDHFAELPAFPTTSCMTHEAFMPQLEGGYAVVPSKVLIEFVNGKPVWIGIKASKPRLTLGMVTCHLQC